MINPFKLINELTQIMGIILSYKLIATSLFTHPNIMSLETQFGQLKHTEMIVKTQISQPKRWNLIVYSDNKSIWSTGTKKMDLTSTGW